jgi:hypothetical protein
LSVASKAEPQVILTNKPKTNKKKGGWGRAYIFWILDFGFWILDFGFWMGTRSNKRDINQFIIPRL